MLPCLQCIVIFLILGKKRAKKGIGVFNTKIMGAKKGIDRKVQAFLSHFHGSKTVKPN